MGQFWILAQVSREEAARLEPEIRAMADSLEARYWKEEDAAAGLGVEWIRFLTDSRPLHQAFSRRHSGEEQCVDCPDLT